MGDMVFNGWAWLPTHGHSWLMPNSGLNSEPGQRASYRKPPLWCIVNPTSPDIYRQGRGMWTRGVWKELPGDSRTPVLGRAIVKVDRASFCTLGTQLRTEGNMTWDYI